MSQIIEIPLEQLRESPFNPRRTFVAIDELAASIQAEGRILQPLLVRPKLANVLRPDGEIDHYEIVFGHRRFRAAGVAELATAPCVVRDMTDGEARSAQIAENLSREDVSPLEEAEGFKALMEHHGHTGKSIARLVGKSEGYVANRLSLNQLCDKAREQLLAGELPNMEATLIARLGPVKRQEEGLAMLKKNYVDLDDGGKRSFRKTRDLLNEHFNEELTKAIFDTEDETLVPEAGACGTCAHRSANAPEFADVASDGGQHTLPLHFFEQDYMRKGGELICTRLDCFAAKKKAHLAREAEKLRDTGKIVIDGNAARAAVDAKGNVKGAFVSPTEARKALKAAGVKAKPEVITIQDPRTGKVVEAVKKKSLEAQGAALEEVKPTTRASSPNYNSVDYQRARQENERVEAARRKRWSQILDRWSETKRTAEQFRVLVLALFESFALDHWQLRSALCKHYSVVEDDDKLLEVVRSAAPEVLTELLVAIALFNDTDAHRDDYPTGPILPARHLDAMAQLLGLPAEEPPQDADESAEQHDEDTAHA